MMGDLITVYIKSPSIPAQGVLGDYIDRCIIALDSSSFHFCRNCIEKHVMDDDPYQIVAIQDNIQ